VINNLSAYQKEFHKLRPKISVLMTVFNAGIFLKPAIDSLLAQTYRNFEIIIIENGSTDNSRKTIHSYNDERLKIFEYDQNIGRTPALIKAFEEANSEYIAIQDADDISKPQRFELQIAYMINNPEIVLLGTSFSYINEYGQTIERHSPPRNPEELYQNLSYANNMAHSSALFRRSTAKNVGGYPADLSYAQDYGLWIRLAKTGLVANLPQELVSIRKHVNRLSNLPAFNLTSNYDMYICFKEARELPNLNKNSLDKNQHEKVLVCGRLAMLNFKKGNLFSAFFWIIRALLINTKMFLKILFLHRQ
jgi:glycosyltransferase involved in cell wall biosynthesis